MTSAAIRRRVCLTDRPMRSAMASEDIPSEIMRWIFLVPQSAPCPCSVRDHLRLSTPCRNDGSDSFLCLLGPDTLGDYGKQFMLSHASGILEQNTKRSRRRKVRSGKKRC